MITIRINTSNAAFNDENGMSKNFIRNMETVRILEGLVKNLKDYPDNDWSSVILHDMNGNSVGNFTYNPED